MSYTEHQLKSNFNLASSFLKAKQEQEQNLYVVCHSHTMQDFLSNYTKYQKEKKGFFRGGDLKCSKKENYSNTQELMTDISNENMWEFTINNDNKNITFIRHAFSVANIYNERAKVRTTFGKNKYNQLQEKDSKLSLFGILSALKLSSVKDYKVKIEQNVYVSCLIRTWMTALCLFLPKMKKIKNNNKQKILNLVVTDGIKENAKTDDNNPEDIGTQIINIKYFYKLVKILSKNCFNLDLNDTNLTVNVIIEDQKYKIDPVMNNQVVPDYKFFNMNNNYNIYYGKNDKNVNKNLYIKFNLNMVNSAFTTCITNNFQFTVKEPIQIEKVNRFKIINMSLDKYKNFRKNNDDYKIKTIQRGFPKPNITHGKDILLKEDEYAGNNLIEINRLSRWREPFSRKGGKNCSNYFSCAKSKKNYTNPETKEHIRRHEYLGVQENNENNKNKVINTGRLAFSGKQYMEKGLINYKNKEVNSSSGGKKKSTQKEIKKTKKTKK